MNFDALYTNPNGHISRAHYVPALVIVLAAILFFTYVVTGRTAQFCVLVLLYPLFVLLTQRLRDMGAPVWSVLLPLVLMLANMAIQLGYTSFGATVDVALFWLAPALTAAFALWGCAKK